MIPAIRLLILVLFGFCGVASLSAQTMSVFNIDASGYPAMKANLIVADQNESTVRNFTLPGDLVVTENGQPVSNLQVTCPPFVDKQCVNVVMVIDQSLSMYAPIPPTYTMTRLEAVKAGALTFLQTIDFKPPTVVALTSFDKYAYILNDFSGSRLPLENKVQKIEPNSDPNFVGTNYFAGLADPFNGALPLLQQRSKQCPRVIVFLTDGSPVPSFYEEQADAIIKDLKTEEIQVYAISIGSDYMDPQLKRVATESGGSYFVKANPTVDELKGIYKQIAEQIQGAEPCTITWQAEVGCGEDSKIRALSVQYRPLGITAEEEYTAPETSVARLQQSAFVIAFGNPAVNGTVTKQLKITARNAPFVVSQAVFEPANPYFRVVDWGGATPEDTIPFTLDINEERTLTVAFTQLVSQEYRSAQLRLVTEPCQIEPIAVWGGAPPEAVSPLRLFSPNGDRDLSLCDTTAITWGGIPENMPVQLSYSVDSGKTWQPIRNNVTGQSFVWQPGAITDGCMIKVESTEDYLDWKWARREGDLEMDRALAVGVDGSSNAYVIGQYSGTIMVDTFELQKATQFLARYASDGSVVWARNLPTAIGARDIAVSLDGESYVLGHTSLTKYRADSTQVWSIRYPAFPLDTLVNVSLDGSGNCWVGGTTTIATGGPIDNYALFIRKYNKDTRQQLASVERADAQLTALAADINGNVVITGYFLGKNGDAFGNTTLNTGYFIAKFDNTGKQLWAKNTDDIRTKGLACDNDGFILQTGWLSGTRKFGSISVTSSGGEDIFITRYNPDGVVQWVKTGGVSSTSSDCGIGIATDVYNNCYVTGIYEKTTGNSPLRIDGMTADAAGKTDFFLAKMSPNGAMQWLTGIGNQKSDSVAALAVDRVGRCYVVGSFEDALNFSAKSVASAGQRDAFIACIGVIPAGADISDSAFSILAPQITVKENPLDVGEIAEGELRQASFQQVVCNTGTQPLRILKSTIAGTHKDDFVLISILDNTVIEPGDCRTVEIVFQPKAVGNRTASLVIEAECVPTTTVPVNGRGLNPCRLDYVNELDAGNTDVAVPITATFPNALCNRGSEPIDFTVSIFGPGRDAYRLQSAGTVRLGPGECYTLVVEFTPVQPGEAEAAYVSYTSECGPLVATLGGRGVPVPPVIEAAEANAGVFLCPGGVRDTFAIVRNLGKTDLVISAVALARGDQGFSVLSWPQKVAPQMSDTIHIRFAPATAGVKTDEIVITSNASNEPEYRVAISGRLYNIVVDVPTGLDFGVVAPIAFPVQQTITVRNTGDLAVQLTAASFGAAQPFAIVSGIPATLAPGAEAQIVIEFGDPGTNGVFNETLALTCEPSCQSYSVPVIGRRSAAEALLSVPALTADPHDRNFHIPVTLVPGGDFSLAQGRTFVIRMTYNDRLFFARRSTNGRIVSIDTLAGINRVVVTIEGETPSSGTVLTELVGDVLLGDTVETPIDVTVVDWEDVVGTVQQNGTLRLINTTDNNGLDRLINDRNRKLGIARVMPNPANAEAVITLHTVEIGDHALDVYDAGGRRIYSVTWTEVPASLEANTREVILPTDQFPVGSYNLVLRTPTRTAEGRLVVIR